MSKIIKFNINRIKFIENEPNVIRIKEPVIIVGDIHG
jgi:hypothetical protein